MNGTPQNGRRQTGTQGYNCTQALPATILLVEDEPSVRLVTRQSLQLGGYNVLEADSAAAALRIALQPAINIDLLLTDMIMPGMNGAELARHMRERRPGLVTLFMTGYAENDALRLATLEVKHKHIQKPFTISNLLTRVADALAARFNDAPDYQAPQCPSP